MRELIMELFEEEEQKIEDELIEGTVKAPNDIQVTVKNIDSTF